jgi:hypothetical protein
MAGGSYEKGSFDSGTSSNNDREILPFPHEDEGSKHDRSPLQTTDWDKPPPPPQPENSEQ